MSSLPVRVTAVSGEEVAAFDAAGDWTTDQLVDAVRAQWPASHGHCLRLTSGAQLLPRSQVVPGAPAEGVWQLQAVLEPVPEKLRKAARDARKVLERMTKGDISEIASMKALPPLATRSLQATCALLGLAGTDPNILKSMLRPPESFLTQLTAFDPESADCRAVVDRLGEFVADTTWTAESCGRVSLVARHLCTAIRDYHDFCACLA